MKKVTSILAGFVGALSLMALMPVASFAADTVFAKIVPSETQVLDTGTPHFIATPSRHDMDVSEAQGVDTTGPAFVVTPSNDYASRSIVARAVPSETQKANAGNESPTVAHMLRDSGRKIN